jgi:hypothetical protein
MAPKIQKGPANAGPFRVTLADSSYGLWVIALSALIADDADLRVARKHGAAATRIVSPPFAKSGVCLSA